MKPDAKHNWFWKSIVSGICGSLAHSLLMLFKSASGILPGFEPYNALQQTLSALAGTNLHPLVPWALSFLNGSVLIGLFFGAIYRRLPGTSGAMKGVALGVIGWIAMCVVFFPAIGLGFFAAKTGSGIWPAAFALAMILTYSIVTGLVYDRLRT